MKNDYYAYLHRQKDTNQVFYVGSGRGRRAFSQTGRGDNWLTVVQQHGFIVEVIASNLSKDNSLLIEQQYFDEYSEYLVNKNRPTTTKSIEYSDVVQEVFICSTSPSGLSWVNHTTKVGRKQTHAGSLYSRDNYWRVTINGKRYMAHRIVWLLAHKNLSTNLVIDHIDGNRANNSLDNLREVSYETNSRNVKVSKNNNLGVLGVRTNRTGYNVSWTDQEHRLQTIQIPTNIFGFHALFYANIYSHVMRKMHGGVFDEDVAGVNYEVAKQIVTFIHETLGRCSTNTGVPFISKDKRGMLIAQREINGKKYAKSFSIKKYGYDEAMHLCKEFLRQLLA